MTKTPHVTLGPMAKVDEGRTIGTYKCDNAFDYSLTLEVTMMTLEIASERVVRKPWGNLTCALGAI